MAIEDKLDLLLRRIEEYELRREEADRRTRADIRSLIDVVEACTPEVGKKAKDLPASIKKEQSKVTPTTCSTKCSSPDIEPNLTVVAVDKCATTAMASMKLVADDGATSTTKIPTTDYSKETHAKCSMLGFDVKWDANKADITFLTKTVVLETVPASIASLSAFSPRMIADIKHYTLMPTRYSAKCSGSNNSQVVSYLSFLSTPVLVESVEGHLLVPWQLLLQHFEVDPWPPITSRDQELIILESQLMSWLAFNCSCCKVHILPPWPPPTEAKWFQLFVGKQFSLVNSLNIIHVMFGPLVWDPGDGKVHLCKISIWMDDWFPQHYFHWR